MYDVIPTLVMSRVSFAAPVWELFHLLPPPPSLISVWSSASPSAGRLPPVATDGSHQSPRPDSPMNYWGRRSVPVHPRTVQGRKQMEGGHAASIKTKKNGRRPETRRGGENTVGHIRSEVQSDSERDFFLQSLLQEMHCLVFILVILRPPNQDFCSLGVSEINSIKSLTFQWCKHTTAKRA